jgi:signal transduction histidine kinase
MILVLNQIKHDIQLKTFLANNLPVFPGYPQEISQIIINLLTNAKDAIQEKGLNSTEGIVEICTEYEPDFNFVVLIIKDNGCGISKKHLQRIYDPFYTTKPIGKGTGLGLNIVHKIVAKHEGKISVNSQKNIGTEFSISFPVLRKISIKKSFSSSDSTVM